MSRVLDQQEVINLRESYLHENDGFYCISPEPCCTPAGTWYLCAPGVACIGKPQVRRQPMREFLNGFDDSLGFGEYRHDTDHTGIGPGAHLCMVAGQSCYLSFSLVRSKLADAWKYFKNIRESGHGSVLEHANYSFLVYGISRSCSHEIVRHRAGVAVSQASQRYIDGSKLRFVERLEYSDDETLHNLFVQRIDKAADDYEALAQALIAKQRGSDVLLSAESKTDMRKKVNQSARSLLPNETEAPMVLTMNIRAWRHFLEMRCSEHAETEVRRLAFYLYMCLVSMEPVLFEDYHVLQLDDGTWTLDTNTQKV